MNDSRAKFECRKFRKLGEDQYSIKLEGYPDEMIDLAAMTIVSIVDQTDVNLAGLLTLVKVKAMILKGRQQVLKANTIEISQSFMDEFINKDREAEEDGRE